MFLRSRGGTDPVNCLWVVDAATGEERLVADPDLLLGGRDDELPPEEQARRERARETGGGITAFATDGAVTVTAFAIGGRLFVGGLLSGQARELPVAGPVFDPRPDPLARRVAYVSGRLLCLAELDGRWTVLAGGDDDEPESVTWGSADFIAAEEMGRLRGYWWSPDGSALAVCRVDTAPVQRWYLADPADPAVPPRELAYPAAGTPNADVTLHVIGLDGDDRRRRVGSRCVPLPRRRAMDRCRPDRHGAVARPARARRAPRRSATGGTDVARVRGPRRAVGRARRRAFPACSATARSSRVPTATAAAGCSSTASR